MIAFLIFPSLLFLKRYNIMCDLCKTIISKLMHYRFFISRLCDISWTFLELSCHLYHIPMFVSLTVSAILKILTIFLFKILCWRCWKTAAVYQRMTMLDEWDEDNELAPLEHVVERACFTFTSVLHPSPIVPLVADLV